ncbi:hypothetical protein M8494_33110 (plasmid) [Serratia ureilytica]
MLTLFLLTTSIHPMMGALKNVTPDAPANTGHVTPEVWSAGNAGKQSFGDQTHRSHFNRCRYVIRRASECSRS